MQILNCPALPPLVDDVYCWFERMATESPDRLRNFEQAVGASTPDEKQFLDVTGVPMRSYVDSPVHRLLDAMMGLLDANLDALSRVVLPTGPPLRDLLARPDDHVLRLSRYPATDVLVVNHPHTDIDLLTMLPGATAPGLEIQSADGWRSVVPTREEVVVLAGEFIELFGGVTADVHRVAGTTIARMSISFFVNAEPDLAIADRTVRAIINDRLAAVSGQGTPKDL